MTREQEQKIDTLNQGVDGVIARLNRLVRNQRIRTGLIALAIAVSLCFGISGRQDAHTAHAAARDAARALSDYKAQSSRALIQSCLSANVDRAGQRDAAKADAHDFVVQLVRAGGGDPTTDPRIAIFDAHHGAVIDAHIPNRLCTAAGVACYRGLAPKPCRKYAPAPKEG